ncbi:class I SAM-dependent methyltransferase [Numidum massiliense]|uniref:class I SAM-dependent methyltransferase n=1 Tax=Numidum massiliense TaxID=1522315 RepID=UPI0006D555EC|nr:class I SAM-dependent methyltransferase [Numidum massiliense]
MSIDFHDRKNRESYAARRAANEWIELIDRYCHIQDSYILDVGCGGGIYTKALAQAGGRVTGVDYSAEMLRGAAENCRRLSNVRLIQGDALHTGCEAKSFHIVLERALIHHLRDLDRCFREANRVLKSKGRLIIQDRTPEDCALPGSPMHLRGYFFEKYPRLLDIELQRRHSQRKVTRGLEDNGLKVIPETSYWETRKVYDNFAQLKADLMQRTGRSILHELTDRELSDLCDFIARQLGDRESIREKDRWTIWIAEKQ